MELPPSLFYYYEAAREPFLSISELEPDGFAETSMDEFAELEIAENRFDEKWKRDFYLFFRPYTEQKTRERFLAKGGKPTLAKRRGT